MIELTGEILPNVSYSVYRYLRDVKYALKTYPSGDPGPEQYLRDYFAGLKFISAYPSDLTKLKYPTLAVPTPLDEANVPGTSFFGSVTEGGRYSIPMYGFVLGQGTDALNRLYRDQLMNAVVQLLKTDASDTGIILYDHASKASIGSVEVVAASGRVIPVNAPVLEADRFKFVVTADVDYA